MAGNFNYQWVKAQPDLATATSEASYTLLRYPSRPVQPQPWPQLETNSTTAANMFIPGSLSQIW